MDMGKGIVFYSFAGNTWILKRRRRPKAPSFLSSPLPRHSAGQQQRNASIVMDALQKINREDGITVLCNLHTLDTAKAYCERIIGMKHGAFVFDGPPSDLKLDMLRDIYGVGEDEDDEEFSTAITSTSIEVVNDGAEQTSDGEAASD